MKYLSLCSGIEAASMAWQPLGWECVGMSEIEPFPCAVLAHHYPDVPNLGDMTKIDGRQLRGSVDLIVGGTPCQDFSVAGLRAGLDGERGNLTFEYIRLVNEVRPRWFVWENVPGVLSIDSGQAFQRILSCMVECGYGVCYRILDAQYFGVAQRRRRVFVVGHLGDWRPAAAVLFERDCLRRDTPPSREAGQSVAGTVKSGSGECGWPDPSDGNGGGLTLARSLRTRPNASHRADSDTYVAAIGQTNRGLHTGDVTETMRSDPHGALPMVAAASQSGGNGGKPSSRGEHIVAAPLVARQGKGAFCDPVNDNVICGLELSNQGSGGNVGWFRAAGPCRTLDANSAPGIAARVVRRLTPRECERLQGFPDDYTLIQYQGKPAADGPRYRALGNSMAVPVMAWIGKRIAMVEAL